MPLSPKSDGEPPVQSAADIVDVIDRIAHIENIINQVIVGYCKPRKEAWEFMWSIVLDTSVMPLGAKAKVVMALSQEIGCTLDKNSLHKVIALRNAFAHHASNAHPVFIVGRTPEENTSLLQILMLDGSGKVSRISRHEAFIQFNAVYQAARESLLKLLNIVRDRCGRSDV